MKKSNSIIYPIGIILIIVLYFYFTGAAYMLFAGRSPESASPLTTPVLWVAYRDNKTVEKRLVFSHIVAFLPFVAFGFLVYSPKKIPLHGEARFATKQDVHEADLFKKTGILLGKHSGKPIFMDGPYLVSVTAENRSGKGVSFVIPNLLTWQGSAVISDMKFELWKITSGFRRAFGQKCYLFSPLSHKTARSNPLYYISDDKIRRIDDISKISNHFLSSDHGKSDIWEPEARKLLEGLILLCIDLPQFETTLGQVFRLLHTKEKTHEYLESLIIDHEDVLDPLCVMNLSAWIQMPDKQRGGIKTHLTSALNLFSNPLIDAATSANDFDLRDLKHKKLSIYVGIKPGDLGRLAPLINLFFQLTIDLNTRMLPEDDPNYKHRCLLMMDEFANLGRMETIEKGVSYIAGYGLNLAIIIQSEYQLNGVYGKDMAKNIITNMHARVNYTPNTMENARLIADELGNITTRQESKSRKTSTWDKSDRSVSVSQVKRALMLPQEIMRLKKDKSIVFVKGCYPIMADRYFYYKESEFTTRLLDPPEVKPIEIIQHQPLGGKMELAFDDVDLSIDPNKDPLSDDEAMQAVADIFNSLQETAA
ncbi:MAG: type IV secretory system conjugative DNA transfer family protein [Methylococcaceae bacterium]